MDHYLILSFFFLFLEKSVAQNRTEMPNHEYVTMKMEALEERILVTERKCNTQTCKQEYGSAVIKCSRMF